MQTQKTLLPIQERRTSETAKATTVEIEDFMLMRKYFDDNDITITEVMRCAGYTSSALKLDDMTKKFFMAIKGVYLEHLYRDIPNPAGLVSDHVLLPMSSAKSVASAALDAGDFKLAADIASLLAAADRRDA